ncbi:stage II sporulation protein P [Cellulosilyticum sp. I15G10I2]|uniref:stage II sporulation protein P n=1 Tax=Cellulosilyticum sp. I15G10I2 TaxID=1892843 RepID=UPI00085BEC4F|nr:stage II sporulation protein P [Cellulosilyticum sp. I15G10I2]
MKHVQNLYWNLKDALEGSLFKKIVLYVFIMISLLNTFKNIDVRYSHSTSQLIVNKALPHFKGNFNNHFFLKNYVYDYINIMWGEPLTLITHAIPYLKNYTYLTGVDNHDINGYFDAQNTDESFIYSDENNYSPKLPTIKKMELSKENYKDPYYLLKYFITGDAQLELNTEFLKQWDFYDLMTRKLRITDKGEGPKVLIFHTHAREMYKDGISVVDVGNKLKQIFEKDYGIETLHITNEFYADQTGNTTGAYEIMEKTISKILENNPSIEISIDIHRDGVPENVHLLTSVDNRDTAKIMFVNGLCMNRNIDGEIVKKKELKNPYLDENLAFSLQAQETAYKYYPDLMKKVYFKEYRYSLHMRPFSLLVEIGAQTNTGQEALNAAIPLANIIAKVIEKD